MKSFLSKQVHTVFILILISFYAGLVLAAEGSVKPVLCPSCSVVINTSSNFCSSCGYSLKDVSDNSEFSKEFLDKLRKSVVKLEVTFNTYDKRLAKEKMVEVGSGVFISTYGYILTVNHIFDMSLLERLMDTDIDINKIKVITHGNRVFYATLIQQDPYTDLAVISISTASINYLKLEPGKLGIGLGDKVVAIGSPLTLEDTVSIGRVCKERRYLNSGGLFHYEHFLQLDARLNQGNSGGPVINSSGNIVGIVSAKAFGEYSDNLCFAVPLRIIKHSLRSMMYKREPVYPWLGVWVDEKENGELVVSYVAVKQKNGLEPGDVIIDIYGNKIDGLFTAQGLLLNSLPDTSITITVLRDNSLKDVVVTTSQRPLNVNIDGDVEFRIWGIGLKEEKGSNVVKIAECDSDNTAYQAMPIFKSSEFETKRYSSSLAFLNFTYTQPEKKEIKPYLIEPEDVVAQIEPIKNLYNIESCLYSLAAGSLSTNTRSMSNISVFNDMLAQSSTKGYIMLGMRIKRGDTFYVNFCLRKIPVNRFL
ncbi:MAG: trypsin-like peptidase domain-containing protein [Elusimicrobiota bacterium]